MIVSLLANEIRDCISSTENYIQTQTIDVNQRIDENVILDLLKSNSVASTDEKSG